MIWENEKHCRTRIVAPAGHMNREELNTARNFASRIVPISAGPDAYAVCGRFAGPSKERAHALTEILCDKNVENMLCLRGGYGSGQLIEHLDFEKLKYKSNGRLIGYSDPTYLGAVLQSEVGLKFIHAPMVVDFLNKEKEKSVTHLLQSLNEDNFDYTSVYNQTMMPVSSGVTRGKLVGGNLSMMCSLLGTRWQNIFDGSILIVEEYFEYLFRIDRMFLQLKSAGVLDVLKGIIIGGFDEMQDSTVSYGSTYEEIIFDNLVSFKGPIAKNAPFGHGKSNYPIKLYDEVEFCVSKDCARLTYLD